MRALGTLDYALLGLLLKSRASGYDIRKVMQETPMGRYSDSPGSIYPALRRLERMGLVTGRAEDGGRHRYTLALTTTGRMAFRDWLTAPIENGPVDTSMLDLRLAFMSEMLPLRRVRQFLGEYAVALDNDAARLVKTQVALRPQLTLSARLALSKGVAMLRHQARWCRTRSQTSR